jgi:selenide,water dikinase
MNLMMFPSKKIPHDAFAEILRGGYDKISESGAVIVGGHTIDDYPPKYGLSVTGLVHPDRIITNAAARPGDKLILTKRIGTGVAIAGRKANIATHKSYDIAVTSMKHLNRTTSEIMQKYSVRCATDITGFSLLGHALKLATASNVTLCINPEHVPLIDGVYDLAQIGCIPGASFRNQEFAESSCSNIESVDYTLKMLLFDAQTSGGLLICTPADEALTLINELHSNGETISTIIGEVVPREAHPIRLYQI